MSVSNELAAKVAICSTDNLTSKIEELETEWVLSLLRSARVPQFMLDKFLNPDSYDARAWRNYLFDNYGITITKNLNDNSVDIFQVNLESGRKAKIGRWDKPEVSQLRKDGGIRYQLKLKFWQII